MKGSGYSISWNLSDIYATSVNIGPRNFSGEWEFNSSFVVFFFSSVFSLWANVFCVYVIYMKYCFQRHYLLKRTLCVFSCTVRRFFSEIG